MSVQSSQVVTLSKRNFINKALEGYTRPYNILLLSEGFQKKAEFMEFCTALKDEFFKIKPFQQCKNHINLIAHFTPSTKNQLDGSSAGTVYGGYIQPATKKKSSVIAFNAQVVTQNLYEVVSSLEFVHGQVKYTGAYTWHNKRNKSFGAIAIVANTILDDARTFEIPEKEYSTGKLMNLPFFTTPLHGYTKGAPPKRRNGFHQYFVHELGHAVMGFTQKTDGTWATDKVGLADEYETKQERYSGNEPPYPNVTKVDTVMSTSSGIVNIDEVKWKRLATQRQRDAMSNGDPSAVLLKRPSPNSPAVIPPEDNTDYASKVFYDPNEVLLKEGGLLYNEGIFRPNYTCIMRFHYTSPEFCNVCEHHIVRAITGLEKFHPGEAAPYLIPETITRRRLLERLSDSLTLHVDFESGNLRALSIHRDGAQAAARMAIMLRQVGVNSNLRVIIGQGHVCLIYGNVIIDPSFYQLYISQEDQISYQYKDQQYSFSLTQALSIQHFDITKGFVGDFEFLRHQFLTYWPFASDWLHQQSGTSAEDISHEPQGMEWEFERIIRHVFDRPGYELIGSEVQFVSDGEDLQQKLTFEKELVQYDEYKKVKDGTAQWTKDRVSWDDVERMYDPINLKVPNQPSSSQPVGVP